MPVTNVEMPVVKVAQETFDTRTLRLQPPAGYDMNWVPGQFITVNFLDDPKTKRAYSLSCSPLDDHFLEITIKRFGHMGTRLYDHGNNGTELSVIPPRGKFMLPADPELPVMLLSGGSGVTP